MVDQKNPAGRLYKLLMDLKSLPSEMRAMDAWAQVIGCKVDDVEVTLAVVEAYELSQDVKLLIMNHESINQELYLKSFGQLDKLFFPLNLNFAIQRTQSLLSNELLTRLQFCAEVLGQSYSEKSITATLLQKLSNDAVILNNRIQHSVLPERIRLELLKEVDKVKRSMSLYAIKGAKGLKEASHNLLGTVITTNEKLNRLEDKLLLSSLVKLIREVDDVSSQALQIQPISADIHRLLPRVK